MYSFFSLEEYCTIFLTKVMFVMAATPESLRRAFTNNWIHILSEDQAALQALEKVNCIFGRVIGCNRNRPTFYPFSVQVINEIRAGILRQYCKVWKILRG